MCKYLLFIVYFILFFSGQAIASERIISLKPNITEILYALGFGDQLVGVTSYCDTPEAAKQLPRVADYVHVDSERVLLQKPTIVVASEENSRSAEIDFLRSMGIKVNVYPFGRLADVYASIVHIAQDLHVESKGKELALNMEAEVNRLAVEVKKLKLQKNRALAVVGSKPLVVVGGNNLLNDVFTQLGLVNVAGESKLRYPTFSTEQFILSKPDMIIDLTMGSEKASLEDRLDGYKSFTSIPAVQNSRIYFMDMNDYRPSPHLIKGLQSIVEVLR